MSFWLILLVLVIGGAAWFIRKGKLCEAHVYKHLETGELLYCDEEQATHRDYQYLGTAKVKCEKVNRCSLA